MTAASDPKLKYVQFADQLRQQIESGEFKAGDRLPSYAELRERHGLTQPTIDRGHALLERDGYIERIKGRGTFVALGKAPGATRESGWSLLRKSVVVLAPEIEVPLSGHRQSGWSEYLVLGAIHQLRLNKQPIITLDRSSIKAQDVRQLAEEELAGVIVIGDPVIEDSVLRAAAKMRLSGVPVVVYGDSAEVANFNRVTSDHGQGSYELTHWLIERGCQRILEFWPAPADSYWLARRHEGYERAMREAGLESLPPCLHPSYEPVLNDNERFQKAIRVVAGYLAEHLSKNPVQAIMAASDGNVSVIAGACRLLGKEPNKDVLIVGYDHFWEDTLERQLEPTVPLATVDKRNPEIGAAMVQMVNEYIAGRIDDSPQCRMLAPRLVVY